MDISKYLGKDVVVFHCDTEEKANELLGKLHYLGFKWDSGESLLDRNYWSSYDKDTCYPVYMHKNKKLLYYYYSFFEGKIIVEYILDKDVEATNCDNMNFSNVLDVLENELFTENKMPVL